MYFRIRDHGPFNCMLMSRILPGPPNDQEHIDRMGRLLANRISILLLEQLRDDVTANDLSWIIQRIYDLNESTILQLASLEKLLVRMNTIKNTQRNQRFFRKIRGRFRQPGSGKHQVVLAEGDSWFNYPIILTDIIDRIGMDPDLAVYSIASGGDWLLNMLHAREYVEELSVSHPDWFLISGGGNDLVGSRRLASIVDPSGQSLEFGACEFAEMLMKNRNPEFPFDETRFKSGLPFLSKDFYALLMFFHLQYSYLIRGILHGSGKAPGKFGNIRIITQGYDYPIPSFHVKWGLNPFRWYIPFIRRFLGHGSWLKQPLQIRGINDPAVQRNMLYAMIFLFNEMMIYTGRLFNQSGIRVFHIDSRGAVGDEGWADELHPLPGKFLKIGSAFVSCIRQDCPPTYEHVYVVSKL